MTFLYNSLIFDNNEPLIINPVEEKVKDQEKMKALIYYKSGRRKSKRSGENESINIRKRCNTANIKFQR